MWDRPCSLCEKYSYTAEKGLRFDPLGNPYKRPPGVPTPCGACPKVPDHVKEWHDDYRVLRAKAEDMTDENRQAYKFYKQCKATGRFPDDPIVSWYSGIIRNLEDIHARSAVETQTVELGIIGTMLKARL